MKCVIAVSQTGRWIIIDYTPIKNGLSPDFLFDAEGEQNIKEIENLKPGIYQCSLIIIKEYEDDIDVGFVNFEMLYNQSLERSV